MSGPQNAERRPNGKPGRRRTNRRRFLRESSALSLTMLTGAGLLAACSPLQTTPTPTSPPQAPPTAEPTAVPPTSTPATAPADDASGLMKALRERKSATGFQPQALPQDVLLTLLWAAWGINRPESGKRTAPSAMNAQEMDLYVLLAEGAFLYDAKANKLVSVVSQDLRAQAGGRGAMRDAPVQLVYVADYARTRVGSPQRELYSASHAGFIGQNVYLFCAAQGLGARFYASVDAAALKASLSLRENQAVLFGQAVGYAR